MAAKVTKYGFIETAKLLTAIDSPVAFAYMAIGTGSTAEGTDCTSLIAEIEDSKLSRVSAATVNTASSQVAGDTCLFTHVWSATDSSNVKECGVFNSSAANKGDMLCYATFADAIPMQSADTLKITWSVQVKAGA